MYSIKVITFFLFSSIKLVFSAYFHVAQDVKYDKIHNKDTRIVKLTIKLTIKRGGGGEGLILGMLIRLHIWVVYIQEEWGGGGRGGIYGVAY